MNSSWKVGLELFLIVLLWKNLSFDDTRYKTPWEETIQKNGKHFLCILGFHLLVGSRSKAHVHKGVRFPSKQVGFGQVLVFRCNLKSKSCPKSDRWIWCDVTFPSWTYPPLEHPEDETLGLVVVVDPVLELGRARWGLRLGLGLLIWRAEAPFHGLARWRLRWWL